MKKTLHVTVFLMMGLCTFSTAHAYKLVIYTDEVATKKATEVAELMKNTYPFTKYDMEVEVVRIDPSELDCGSSLGIDRLITCKNSDGIQARAMRLGGDQAMIIKDVPEYGGSSAVGSGVPVITTNTPARGMLHEFLHTLGMNDEYPYSAKEAKEYCKNPRSSPNLAFIAPLSGYADDSMARSKHSGAIPWYRDILDTTPITNSGGTLLGTGDVDLNKPAAINTTKESLVLGEPSGLYMGEVCKKAVPEVFSWLPGSGSTIMDKTGSGLGAPLERAIDRIMASKGARKKMQMNGAGDDEKPYVSNGHNDAGKVVVNSDPQVEVNDSGRGLFKSFFQWLHDIFNQIMNSIPK